jgi:hypothetical protein
MEGRFNCYISAFSIRFLMMNLIIIIKKALSNLSKIPLAMKIELKSLAVILRYGMPDITLEFLGGLGDELLLSIVAQELKKRKPELKIWQISPAAELLFNNPCYSIVFSSDYWFLRYTNLLNSRRRKIDGYINTIIAGESYEPPAEHIAAIMCRKAGIKGQILLEPRVFLTRKEIDGAFFAKGSIVVNCPGKDSYAHMKNNKLWYLSKFQKALETINSGNLDGKKYTIIQLGGSKDPILKGAIDLRGKTTLRESAAILQNCEFFLGMEGFLMHLARAVDCRSVIIYGGFAHSWQTGYICNENIDSKIDCAPCWKFNYCDRDRACMKAINVDDVLQASQRLLLRKGLPLEVDSVCI